MKEHFKFAIRAIAFTLILCFVVTTVNYVVTPKKYYEDSWSTTSTFKGFYKMKRNTVDVLFLGSSHGGAAFNPQVVYDNNGIRSYNLCCEQQNLLVSYYWLQEALRFQNPSAVVLELYMLYTFNPDDALNTAESFTRMAIDAMKWSGVKWNCINDICKYDESQTVNSYLFTNERFHTRWMNLAESDFVFASMEKHFELKGFAPLAGRGGVYPDYQPYLEFDHEQVTEMHPLMSEYLDKIVALCKEKGIQLILTKTPTTGWDTSKHNTVKKYADENNLEFIDFNENAYYEASKFKYSRNMSDDWHCNIRGAKKLSKYMGNTLLNDYDVAGIEDEQWSSTKDYYKQVLEDCELQNISDLGKYINLLANPRYTVFLAGQSDVSYCLDDEAKAEFAKLGFDLSMEEGESFCGIKSEEILEQQHDTDMVRSVGSIRKSRVDYSIVSKGEYAGNESSIMIDNEDYSLHVDGINIVVYCNDTRRVIDRAAYVGALYR
ncbi:hypothetical protein [Butyrivibrio sp. AE3004]|uniref:hypothetical protein n=1 Tax=Butyrivibrio sp. AE3004 TaxID=1506994 RepID=UPI0004947489|nr:hypothetical protein [Butyrivibrio sp. AE3004]